MKRLPVTNGPVCRAHHVLPVVLLFLALLSVRRAEGAVPPPSETPCEVIVNGRTSTLKSIVIRKVGKEVPKIFRGEKTAGNTPGFEWYVSQHYALKADVGDDKARHFLTLSELAYPHFVHVIGREPPGIGTTRMAFVHASSIEKLQEAVRSDIGSHWAQGGGGVTLPANWVAYNYPSGGLQYHFNDLSMHENLHLLHCCVQEGFHMPLRFGEGITHMFANHVYEPEKKRLTVAVFDKAPINNPVDEALRTVRKEGALAIAELIEKERPGHYPQPETLWTAFFWSNPTRLMKWRLWRDELLSRRLNKAGLKELDVKVMKRLCGGSFDALDKEWQAWLLKRRNTFTHIDWGWEQWGGTLQSYGWPWKKNLFSQMDINYAPGRALTYDPLRMDYPQPGPSPLIGKVVFGGEEPVVGCVVAFSQTGDKGWAGMGLGVEGRRLFRLVVEQNKKVVMDGTALGFAAARRDIPFSAEFLAAAGKSRKTGLTIKVAEEGLEVMLRAGEGDAQRSMLAVYPLKEKERYAIMTRHMALISRDGKHLLTPYLDAKCRAPVGSSAGVGPNRWGFSLDHETYQLHRAAWVLGDRAPTRLLTLRDVMTHAMDKDARIQEKAASTYKTAIPKVTRAVAKLKGLCSERALAELSGVRLVLRVAPDATAESLKCTAYILNQSREKISGLVNLTCSPEGAVRVGEEKTFEVGPGREVTLDWLSRAATSDNGVCRIEAIARFNVNGALVRVAAEDTIFPSIPRYQIIGPFDNKGNGEVDTPHAAETEPFDADQTYRGHGGKDVTWRKKERSKDLKAVQMHIVDLRSLYGNMQNVAAIATVWVVAPKDMQAVLACGSDDGIVAWVNGERALTRLKNRGYSRHEDRALIRLKAGVNQLTFRVTQASWGWRFSAELLDHGGKPIPGLRYLLLPGR